MRTLSGIKAFWSLFLRRWHNAFPIILFYIAQFLLVIGIFGTTYAMVVSCSTTLFQLRRKEPNHAKDYISMCLTSLVLCLLAFAAGQNVWLCALLNFAVPFFLVIWKCSQFTPKGHMGYAMTFVFLELRPPYAGAAAHAANGAHLLLRAFGGGPDALRQDPSYLLRPLRADLRQPDAPGPAAGRPG